MAKLIKTCSTCGKVAHAVSDPFKTETAIAIILSCGHLSIEALQQKSVYDLFLSTSGKELMQFQKEGIEKARLANFRALFADEQGLGKTVQVFAALKLYPELLPALFITRASLLRQVQREGIEWAGIPPQILTSQFPVPNPFLQIGICSVDSMVALAPYVAGKYKTIIVDECQSIKNHNAKRTQKVREVARDAKYVFGLSGTPIKNNAGEYFPILNLLRPELFPTEASFFNQFVDSYFDGWKTRYAGLSNVKRFQSLTQDFIIRRTRDEVLPDLPKIFRTNFFVELMQSLEDEYLAVIKGFEEEYDAGLLNEPTEMLAWMSKLRHITGISKAPAATEFLIDHVQSTGRKIVGFFHHNDTAKRIAYELKARHQRFVLFSGSMSSSERDVAIQEFKNSADILLASTLAAGEGLNLQFCSDALFIERQWNPANEEQAEGRFPRPGSTANQVNCTYLTVVGTIDEFLANLVEQKRSAMKKTLDFKEVPWQESQISKELGEVLRSSGRKAFSLRAGF